MHELHDINIKLDINVGACNTKIMFGVSAMISNTAVKKLVRLTN